MLRHWTVPTELASLVANLKQHFARIVSFLALDVVFSEARFTKPVKNRLTIRLRVP